MCKKDTSYYNRSCRGYQLATGELYDFAEACSQAHDIFSISFPIMNQAAPGFESDEELDATRLRQLPSDLPKSLDDRQPVQTFGRETEMYDAWQGRVRGSQ